MAKTTIATGLAALLALSALGAFASPQDETAGAPMEITWSGLDGADIFDDNLIEQHIEEKFNVDIINVTYDLYARDAIELTIAADDHADAFYGWIDSIEWFFKGAFRTIPREMLDEHAPRYAAFMDSLGPGAWVYSLAPGSTTEYMGLPRAEQGSQGCDRAPTWRLDWLEQLGMDPRDGVDAETGAPAETLDVSGPTYEDGRLIWWRGHFTYDDFVTALRGFRDGDFDGNGRDDTVPWGTIGDRGCFQGKCIVYWRGLGLMFFIHGVNDVPNYDDNGQAVLEDTFSRSKMAIQELQSFFQEKLIDPDLPAVGREQWGQQIEGGQVGLFIRGYGAGGGVNLYGGGGNDMGDNVLQNNAGSRLVNTYYPLARDGTTKCPHDSSTMSLNPNEAWSVKHDVSDEKLAKLLEIYDYVNHDPEGFVTTGWGIPDRHMEWTGPELYNCETGWATRFPAEEQPDGNLWNFYHAYGLTAAKAACGTPKVDDPLFLRQQEISQDRCCSEHSMRHASPNAREDIANTTRFNELWAQFGGALTTLKQEFWWKAITTDIDIDAEWPKYVETWMNAGGREVLAELQKAPTSADILAGVIRDPDGNVLQLP